MERIDDIITSVLMNTTKSMRGMKRNILFSKEKEIVRAAKLFWKDCIKEIKGMLVNKDRMIKRKENAKIEELDDLTIEQAKERLKIEEEKWQNLIEFGKEIREKELLDYHHYEL